MRCYQVFARMTPAQGTAVLREIQAKAPAAFAQALMLAATTLRARPVYLARQPFEKRAEAVRRALARVASNGVAEEILAAYFLEIRRPLLVEWLDGVGLAHEEGVLKDERPAEPAPEALHKAAEAFLAGEDAGTRTLLLHAFAAQDAIEWPGLEALLEERPLSKA